MRDTDPLDELLTCRLELRPKNLAPCSLVIVGASGDLTSRKLIPALYHLYRDGQLPADSRIVGFARRPKSDSAWRDELRSSLERYSRSGPPDTATWEAFAAQLTYCQGDLSSQEAFAELRARLEAAPHPQARRNRVFYLATRPSQFAPAARHLSDAGLLSTPEAAEPPPRLVVEKPFGHDLTSARQLNAALMEVVHERQVFRIDHYLGKETVQNILLFRFSNSIFEPLWGRQTVDHVQLTVSEQLGVGSRGPYYEEAGALRDMVQNHLLQVLALVAMEPPVSLEPEAIRDEKVKLLRAIRPFVTRPEAPSVVRGQYTAGTVGGQTRIGYRQEDQVAPASDVETYVAWRLMIDNWRWSGVPFYLRTGKCLPTTASEVRVQFRPTPHVLFAAQCGPRLDANAITLRLQPEEGITLRFNGKVPGATMHIRPVRMHFSYDAEFGAYTPEAYERLLLEAMAGDPTLFTRADEVEASWNLIDLIRENWRDDPLPADCLYPAGNWGPNPANALLERDGRAWRNPVVPA